MMMRLVVCYLLSLFIIGNSLLPAQDITIAAAADLRYALNELVQQYKSEHSYSGKISVIFGSSGSLYQQITNSAPFDIFFSADNTFPERLYQDGKTSGAPVQYARGHLVLWSAKLDVSKGVAILKSNKVSKIAIANPEVAPYGKRAIECLSYYKVLENVRPKLVQGENVSQAAQFLLTGNAEIGMIALSLAISPDMAAKGKYFLLDEKSYSPLEQSFVVLSAAHTKPQVAAFVKYLQSKQAREILKKYGFTLPSGR